MKTAVPDILKDLGESEYTVLTSAYCKLVELRALLDRMTEEYVTRGTPPSLDQVVAARLVLNELFGPVEQYVLALSDPAEAVCPLT